MINASLAGVIQEAHEHTVVPGGRPGIITGIYGMVHGIEGVLKSQLIDLGQEAPQTIELLSRTPASALGSCRHKLTKEEYEQTVDVCRAHDICYFVYIGGNDSMDTCHKVAALAQHASYPLRVMGVPKTMDNDLACTDHCPGYGSAARFLALATRDTGRDLEAMATFDDVTILEALGRNAGWLAASSALGKQDEDEAPHLVYVPEIPFDEGAFLDAVTNIHRRLGRVFVVVSEGIRDRHGHFVGHGDNRAQDKARSDRFGHVVHSLTTGVAAYLADLVHEELQIQARFLRPSLIGRALTACVAETDRQEALRVGRDAVAHLAAGRTGYMVALERISDEPYQANTRLAPLADVANAESVLPRDYMDSSGTMITDAFRRYALPLIDGPLPPLARLRGVRVGTREI